MLIVVHDDPQERTCDHCLWWGSTTFFFFFWLDVAYEYEMFCFFLLSSCALLCPRFFFPSHCNFIPSSVTGSCVVIDSSVSFKFACPLSNLAHAFSLPRILSSFSVSLTLQRCIVIFKCFPPPLFFSCLFSALGAYRASSSLGCCA